MYRIDNVIEEWAEDFKPISHDPEGGADGKRFFRIDSLEALSPLVKSLIKISTPVVAYCTQIEAYSNEKGSGTYYATNIFILVPQVKASAPYLEDYQASLAKYEAVEIAQKLRVWLKERKKQKDLYPELTGLDLNSVAMASFPVKLGNWWPLHIRMDYLNADYTCIFPEDYHSTSAVQNEKGGDAV